MSVPAKPWTQDEIGRRDRILSAARARGISNKRLAEAAGMLGKAGEVRMSRWVRGLAHIDSEALDAMEGLLGKVPGSVEPGDASETKPMSGEELRAALAEIAELAGEPGPDEKDELVALAKAHRRSAVGEILRLMVSAKSENVRLRAAENLLERSDGKAIQAVVDMTPRAPADLGELKRKLVHLLAKTDPEQPQPAESPPVPGSGDAAA